MSGPPLEIKSIDLTMAATSPSNSVNSAKFASLKETPEDLEQQAVTGKVAGAQKYVEDTVTDELEKIAADHLEDTLMPPLDMIVAGLQSAVPGVVKSAKGGLDKFFSSLPCSAILHLVLVETLTIWIFYYSVVNTLTSMLKEGMIVANSPTDRLVPGATQTDRCVSEYARKIVWMNGHFAASNCFDETTVDGPWEEDPDAGELILFGYMHMGCFLLCLVLWFVVVGNFCYHTSGRVWVRYHSGTYLKASFITRRSMPYRLTCGLLGVCALLTIGVLMTMCLATGLFDWFISSQLVNAFVVVASMRAFLAPTKPKFEYSELQQLNFKRPTFFQTNGGFAVKLSDALIQSARGSQFRAPLVKLLRQEKDWTLAMHLCFVGQNASGAPNKALLKLWGVAQEHLPTAFEHAPTALNAAKAW
jgi:hypothetical protein